MTSSDNPWKNIPTAEAGHLSRVRVDSSHLHDFFWARNDKGHCMLLLEINEDCREIFKIAKINIREIDVKILEDKKDKTIVLTIALLNNNDADVFFRLCTDLLGKTNSSDSRKTCFELVCKRLKQWQALLSGKKRGLLSREEVQGLFAELVFIKEKITSYNARDLINGWEGPNDGQHDFVLGDTAIEIKSVSGYQRNKVRISSEDQLHSHLKNLFLRVYFLIESPSEKEGLSLNGIIIELKDMLTEPDVIDNFEIRLASTGYIDIEEYNAPHFTVKEKKTYQVTGDFPKITPESINPSIQNVGYDILLSGIEKFRAEL